MTVVLSGTLWLVLYFLVCVVVAVTIRLTTRVPDEVFRKLLHCILLGSLAVWVEAFPTWLTTALSACAFAVAVYPLLWAAERLWKGYSWTLTERSKGELRRSLVTVFVMFAIIVVVCEGIFDDDLLALTSIYAWGFGDAAAALIGKRFGRHKLYGKKSVEGTLAMFITSVISVLVLLLIRGGMPWPTALLISVVTGAVSAAVELFTSGGMDTITCPLAAMTVLLPLVHLIGGGL